MFKRLHNLVEATGFYLLIGLATALGLEASSALGGFIARTLGPHTSQHKRAKRRLLRAMPETSDAEAERILKGMWSNLGRTVGELPHLGKFRPFEPGGRIELEGREVIGQIRESKSGAILVSAHLANWELLPNIMKAIDIPGGSIYRAVNNSYVNDYMLALRKKFVYPVQIPKGAKGVRTLVELVKKKQLLGMLVDQRMSDGVQAPFFGLPAMTPAAPAQLSLKHGVPIVPTSLVRTKGTHFVMKLHPPIAFKESGNREADICALMTRVNSVLEQFIRAHPDQWLWLHRRWIE